MTFSITYHDGSHLKKKLYVQRRSLDGILNELFKNLKIWSLKVNTLRIKTILKIRNIK